MSSASSSPSTDGSAFPWILEHLLAYPGSYEIPLRTMYTLNSTPQAQPYPPRQSTRSDTPSLSHSDGSSAESSPASPSFPPDQQQQLAAHGATEHFKSCLMTHISQLPSQPFSLPPSFITSFVRRCFTADLCLVDFTQALTALDYLKDLENRRKRELTEALQRLGLDKKALTQTDGGKRGSNPRVLEWVMQMQDKERKVEALYTQVYLGLRRWTLINEMRLEPFNKNNSLAMLNTLYPPTTANPPTRQLTAGVLASQRNGFFRYIQGVEKNGKKILKNLEHQEQRPGDANGWAFVRETVDKYLRTANGVIEECLEVISPDSLNPRSKEYHRHERRADSGVSFASGDRPSTGSSTGSKHNNKPLPASPTAAPPPPAVLAPKSPNKKRGTTLEKIFRNLRTRNDVKELSKDSPGLPPRPQTSLKKERTLKKMKSASSIGGSRTKHARSGSDGLSFEIDDLQRQRMILEATREKENRVPSVPRTRTASYEL